MFVFVTMPSCAICRFEAPSDKHLRMHIETKHDDRVLTCEKWKYMQRREEAKDTYGVSQGNYLQQLWEKDSIQ